MDLIERIIDNDDDAVWKIVIIFVRLSGSMISIISISRYTFHLVNNYTGDYQLSMFVRRCKKELGWIN